MAMQIGMATVAGAVRGDWTSLERYREPGRLFRISFRNLLKKESKEKKS